MFERIKETIRIEIGNQKVTKINDDICKELSTIAEKAAENKNFEKAIACREIILDDLGYNSPNTFGEKVNLLSAYDSYGYSDTEEAYSLVKNLVNEMLSSDTPDAVLPQVYIPAIKILYSSGNSNDKEKALQFAKSSLNVGINMFNNFGISDISKDTVIFSARDLVRIHIDRKEYQEAEKVILSLPDELNPSQDLILLCLYSILISYRVVDADESLSKEAINTLKMLEKVPEAHFALGMMAAEGYKMPRNIQLAKEHFKTVDNLISEYKGIIGYTDFEFSVLSDIPKDEIIKRSQTGTYNSKFYIAKLKKNTSSTTSSPSSHNSNASNSSSSSSNPSSNSSSNSSGGCYVATCVYGSYDCPQVWTLRRYRDNILSKKAIGRLFIRLYYAVSPSAVKLFGKYNWFHQLFKLPLDRIVDKLQKQGIESTPYND